VWKTTIRTGRGATKEKSEVVASLGSEGNVFSRAITSPRLTGALFASVLGWEFGILLVKASRTHFWYDELLTLRVSSLHPFSLLWRALRAGADGMPPSYYGIVQLARILPGDPHVILRLPSILGYLLTLLGVYWFARKRLSVFTSLTAALLISLSPFRSGALEARSYTLLVGFLAISAALWQRVGESRFMTPMLGVFLALAVSSHHLAVIMLATFVIAELTWSFRSGRIRWGVWVAFLFATFPFFLSLPILLTYRDVFVKTFWARPDWWAVAETYKSYLGLDFDLAVTLIAFLGIVIGTWHVRRFLKPLENEAEPGFALPEIVLLGGFLAYPALLVVLAKLFHSGYVDRYGWPAVLGLVLGSVCLLHPSRAASACFLAALLFAFAVQGLKDFSTLAMSTPLEKRWILLEVLSREEPNIPVVIGDPLLYLVAVQYSPRALQDRLVQVVDAENAVRLVGSDTPDKTNRLLAQFVPLRVLDLAPFEAACHRRFMLYSGGSFDWFTQYLLEKGYYLRLLSRGGDRSIYIVER
jgi:hypothetical protein